ncbi:nuclear transport factor 2 family protein [Streptomyces sp. GC420]|uniref:nuclear transport factor 2 family protein n=1 Tax=Streptomyces sp. GC420 TaxID=2697568 RepID=UPI0014152717|nr:nuclear transport factor 2 family protein [Streptomyces sp. GC420]NBM19884.1 nuclear transport factor 2 family protein [Streptomyces sp. GC420]
MPKSDERKVQEVLANYVRATDRRDGKAQGALFTDDALVEIFVRTGPDTYERAGEPLIGGAGVEYAVTLFMPQHPEGGTGHHTTSDHLIEVVGDSAHVNAQFVVFETRADGTAHGTPGARGTVRPVESGYYDTDLRRIDGEWRIVHHRVLLDTPIALPAS